MDVSLALDSKEQSSAVATKIVVEDGTLVEGVNDLRVGDRLSITAQVNPPELPPRLQAR